MFDPCFSDFEEMGQAMGLCKLSEDLTLFCGENVLGRCEVIGDQYDAIPMENPLCSDFFKRLDGKRCGDIIPEGQIDPDIEEFAGGDLFLTCVHGQDLFRDGHRTLFLHMLPTLQKKVKAEVKVKKKIGF